MPAANGAPLHACAAFQPYAVHPSRPSSGVLGCAECRPEPLGTEVHLSCHRSGRGRRVALCPKNQQAHEW